MSSASEASTDLDPARRLWVSIAVRPESINAHWAIEGPEGNQISSTRRYDPPHGAVSFVDDLLAVLEAVIAGERLERVYDVVSKPGE